jgi:hypothetical protein
VSERRQKLLMAAAASGVIIKVSHLGLHAALPLDDASITWRFFPERLFPPS